MAIYRTPGINGLRRKAKLKKDNTTAPNPLITPFPHPESVSVSHNYPLLAKVCSSDTCTGPGSQKGPAYARQVTNLAVELLYLIFSRAPGMAARILSYSILFLVLNILVNGA